jgi:hypothetical protein
MLREFERLSPPCQADYMKHRMAEILKKMGADAPAAATDPEIQELE